MTARRDDGFSLAEVLVAMVLMTIVTLALFALANPSVMSAHAQPDRLDRQQRARVAAESLARDLRQAGAGLTSGARAGPLARYFAAVIPRRLGRSGADPPAVARTDAVTLLFVPDGPSETTLSAALLGGAPELWVSGALPCPPGRLLCGLAQGDDVVVFDDVGSFDVFAITGLAGGAGVLQAHDSGTANDYAPGASAALVRSATYYLDRAQRQLRYSDGASTDVPVADHVVDLQFEYLGDPLPPDAPRPPAGVANCLFDAAGQLRPGGSLLASSGGSLAPLPIALLADGPWCGHGGSAYDADALRIRQVKITLRVEAAQDALRGAGPRVLTPGTARDALRAIDDLVLTFTVSPPNLNWAR
jgi:prepilin-type N-terminal cleavage/methylation domain-containing protein